MRLIIIILLALGICFRFVNLDHKIYWYDETFTSLRASGYSEAEVVEHFNQTSIVSVQDLQRYQQPDLQRGIGATLHSLAIEDPQHPPLYYILASYWMRWVGHSVAAMRLLPALLSLLAFPCAYWLCWELFAAQPPASNTGSDTEVNAVSSSAVGWMAIGLLAVSPFHVLYAQEAREYSLWSVTALLATATLLYALRVSTTTSWLLYALSLAASLYTFLFSIWIAVAHAVYVLFISKFRFKGMIPYGLASLLALAVFSPWIWITVENLHQIAAVTNWTTRDRPLISLAMSWASMLGRLFYDRGTHPIDRLPQAGMILLIGLACYTVWSRTPKRIGLLLASLTAVPFLVLILPDLITGGGRSTAPRYLIPALCSIQLTVAHLLATKTAPLAALSATRCENSHKRQCWRWITAVVFTAGILSNLTIAHAQTWWIKPYNQENLAVAHVINQAVHPLVVSDAETADLLSLSYLLNDNTDLLIRPRCYTCPIDSRKAINPAILENWPEHSDIFLFHPRPMQEWQQSLVQIPHLHLEKVSLPPAETLWKVSPSPNQHPQR